MSFDLKLTNGNLSFKNGQVQTVIDSNKLIQAILKMCLTSPGGIPLSPWYGSFISRTIVGNPMYSSTLIEIAKSQLTTSLENLKALQDLQVKSFQRVSAEEQLAAILDISIIRNQLDPRLFDVQIKVLSKGLKAVGADFTVSNI